MGWAIALTLTGGIVTGVAFQASENVFINGLLMGLGLTLLVLGYTAWNRGNDSGR